MSVVWLTHPYIAPAFDRPNNWWSRLVYFSVFFMSYYFLPSGFAVFYTKHFSTTSSPCPFHNTGVFEMTVRVLTTCHLVLQMQPHVISFYGVTSRIRFMFLLFPQVSRNWRYESEPPLKPSPLTCYKQFGTNSIIVLMFVESQRVHI